MFVEPPHSLRSLSLSWFLTTYYSCNKIVHFVIVCDIFDIAYRVNCTYDLNWRANQRISLRNTPNTHIHSLLLLIEMLFTMFSELFWESDNLLCPHKEKISSFGSFVGLWAHFETFYDRKSQTVTHWHSPMPRNHQLEIFKDNTDISMTNEKHAGASRRAFFSILLHLFEFLASF